MKYLVKAETDGRIQRYRYPLSNDKVKNYKMLTKLIDYDCSMIENIRTKRMVDKLGSNDILMLIDDMGKLKDNMFNPIACELYSGKFLGDMVIMGDVLFLKMVKTEYGYDLDGLSKEEALELEETLSKIRNEVNKLLADYL